MKQNRSIRWLLLILMVLALACNFPTPTPEVTPEETKVSEEPTTEAPTPEETAPGATNTPGPTPTEAPAVEGEGGCTLKAAYVADVTVSDDTVIEKGEDFVKTWRLRNSGTCTWEEGTRLVYVSGDTLAAPVSVDVPATDPDAMVDISVEMQAPSEPGTYKSNWQLETAEGKRYGGIFYVQIVVESDATATPTPTSTPTEEAGGATPPTDFTGQVASDCSKVALTWTDGEGEASYRIEGPGFSADLDADATSYLWSSPPEGNASITLIALDDTSAEIGRVTTSVNVSCGTTGAPDLVLQSITFDPATPVAYLPLEVTVEVKNVGDVDADTFVLRWWGGKNFSSVSCEWTVTGGLSAGNTTQLTCNNYAFRSSYSGLTTKAEVDAAGDVDEGSESNNVLERSINVVQPATVYNFVTEAPNAVWQSGDPFNDSLGWNGEEGNTDGFARWDDGPMENNVALQGQCLETHPMWVDDGWIAGYYTDLYHDNYTIQEGDIIYAKVGLLNGAGAGEVTFKVMVRTADQGNHWVGELAHDYGEGIETLRVDLSSYAGERADVVLRVEAGGSSQQDWACWTQAVIYRYP